MECNLAIICACAPALKAFTSQARLESKTPKYNYGSGFTKDTKVKPGSGTGQSATDGTRSRNNDSKRNLVEGDAKQKGDWSRRGPNGSGVTKLDSTELDSFDKEEA